MDYENFSNIPQTLGERRADKKPDCQEWSARDLLINLLRRIDEGTLQITDIVVAFSAENDKGGYYRAGPNPETHVTHMEFAKHRIIQDMCGYVEPF